MVTETKYFRLVNKVVDETFEAEQLAKYNLYLAVGKFTIRIGALDRDRNKFVLLEDYELRDLFTPVQVAQQLQALLQDHPFLSKPDWQVIRVSVKNQNFTLIPETLFHKAAAEDYLRLNCNLDTFHEEVVTYQQAGLDAVNIFTVDKYLKSTLQAVYPGKLISYRHQTSVFISTLLHYSDRHGTKKLMGFVEKNNLTLLVFQGGMLQFCNVFHYTTPEDFIYFLLLIMQEQKLNPEEDVIKIWGDMTYDSALFTMMRKYIRHVYFGNKPAGAAYSYKLEDQFEHRYLDVYGIHFCE